MINDKIREVYKSHFLPSTLEKLGKRVGLGGMHKTTENLVICALDEKLFENKLFDYLFFKYGVALFKEIKEKL